MENCFIHENVWSLIIPFLEPLDRVVVSSVCSFFRTQVPTQKKSMRAVTLMAKKEYWELLYYYRPECSNIEDVCYHFIKHDLPGKIKLLQKTMPSVKSLCAKAAARGDEEVITLFYGLHKNSGLRYSYRKIMEGEVKNMAVSTWLNGSSPLIKVITTN